MLPQMKINQQALEAIRDSAITGPNLAALFKKMAAGVETVGSPGGLLILSYIDPQSMPAEGELVPTLTLALKPFTLRRPVELAPEEPEGPEGHLTGEPKELEPPRVPE